MVAARFARAGIALEPEVSFQGGDGYLWFATPDLALATLTRIAECPGAGRCRCAEGPVLPAHRPQPRFLPRDQGSPAPAPRKPHLCPGGDRLRPGHAQLHRQPRFAPAERPFRRPRDEPAPDPRHPAQCRAAAARLSGERDRRGRPRGRGQLRGNGRHAARQPARAAAAAAGARANALASVKTVAAYRRTVQFRLLGQPPLSRHRNAPCRGLRIPGRIPGQG
jgi:hypothetical protein